MTKEELRTAKIAEGWLDVPAVADWNLVSNPALSVKRYDVPNVFDPKNNIHTTTQVVVKNEGQQDEEAVAIGNWRDDFQESATEWLAAREGATVGSETVFAIGVDKLYMAQEVAIVTAFMLHTTNDNIREQKYVLKRRNNTFSFEAYA